MIGQLLKQADKFLLQHNFEAAEKEVRKALQLEPNNPYARAYTERIEVLRKEYEAKQKLETEQQQEKERFLQRTAVPKPGIPRPSPTPPQVPETPRHRTTSQGAVEEYKEQLFEYWRDGTVTPQEHAELEGIRKRLNISESEHGELEQAVKLKCYVDAVRNAMEAGTISPIKSDALKTLRMKFGVSVEEHLTIEGRLLWDLQHKQHPATIMVIDDEVDLLTVMREGLSLHGYKVITASTPEEALRVFENNVPDLIICDISFPDSQLDGFSLYRKVRSRRELVIVPFIFITGVKDEWIVARGLEIGVDDFLSKPFTMTTILSVIEGKLLRYEELKKAFR